VSDEAIRKNVYSSPVRCADAGAANKMQEAIEGARREGDSVGGVIEARINGLPAGLGEPLFDSFESVLAHWVFSIPATKGVEFGSGFAGSGRLGSQNSDAFYFGKDGLLATKSNNNGGILGGLTSGMPVVMRVAFKPASSINKPQLTANLVSKKQVELKVKGRHDPCVAIRAVPIIEAVCAIASAEFLLASGGLPKVLK
jgi:chorismate synthase